MVVILLRWGLMSGPRISVKLLSGSCRYVFVAKMSRFTIKKTDVTCLTKIERRLAPFWRGLNDHSSSWTEHQLVAAARGLPIPAPDEIPPPEDNPTEPEWQQHPGVGRPNENTPPAPLKRETSSSLSAAEVPLVQALQDGPGPSSGAGRNTPSPLFRGRTKGTPSLGAPRDSTEAEITPQETRLPKQPMINGQPVEAYIYKDVAECPICFLYYPPFLNRTRCCDQYICSECFVQIKRPDPHIPEHADPSDGPAPASEAGLGVRGDGELVSEPATCPFCVTPELGVTYDPPPFRRGIVHANREQLGSKDAHGGPSNFQRQRGMSLSANSPMVVTTDQVRPDWLRKLSEARSHAARRSAAATALHTAAYNMNSFGTSGAGLLGRRRRTLMMGPDGQPSFLRSDGGLNPAHMDQLMAALENQTESSRGQRRGHMQDFIPSRNSSRASNAGVDDLEDMMMMEAIRLSLAAEEERKKKEGKESAKDAKKEEKRRLKEQKKLDKAARKNSSYASSANNSQFFDSSLDIPSMSDAQPGEKGKAKAAAAAAASSSSSAERGQRATTMLGFNPMDEPTSTVNASSSKERNDPQRHLERSRANLSSDLLPATTGLGPMTSSETSVERPHMSSLNTSGFEPSRSKSASLANASNAAENSSPPAFQHEEQAPSPDGQASTSSSPDQPFNFGSLAHIIGREGLSVDSGGRLHASDENRSTSTRAPHGDTGTSSEENNAYEQKHEGQVEVPSHAAQSA